MNHRSSRRGLKAGTFHKTTGYRRTFTGCWRCRKRRIKCDLQSPICTPCSRSSLECGGYEQALVWVSSDQKTYRQNARRYVNPYDTWKDTAVISSTQLDTLIYQCDYAADGKFAVQEPLSPFGVFPTVADDFEPAFESHVTPESLSPSSIDNASRSSKSDQAVLSGNYACSESHSTSEEVDAGRINEFQTMELVDAAPVITLPLERPIEWTGHGLPYRHAFLLDVYVSLVIPTLVPIHDDRNPWLQYPAIALHLSRQEGKQILLHALLAHAAFSLSRRSHKRQESCISPSNTQLIEDELAEQDVDGGRKSTMVKLGCKFYSLATTELRACIQDGSIGCLDLLTTTLSLLLVEMAHGSSKSWRYHLEAAWRYLQHQHSKLEKFWSPSVEVWYATQSFYLLKTGVECSDIGVGSGQTSTEEVFGDTISNISSLGDDDETTVHDSNKQQNKILDDLMCDPEYGRTAGASSSVLGTIAEVSALAAKLETKHNSGDTNAVGAPLHLTRALLECQHKSMESFVSEHSQSLPQDLHLRAFQASTVIYYYQTCDRVSPRSLSSYVTVVLRSLRGFYETRAGACFTLWPLIIAAVEAVDAHQQAEVMQLLDYAAMAGMRNLTNHGYLIRRVWQAREQKHIAEGSVRLDETRVDWRHIMKEAGLDLLVF